MERIIDIAQCVYDEYKKTSGEAIDEMKLHKLLYLVQRESLAITGQPLFIEEFEGWKHGPVCREVRYHYSEAGISGAKRQVSPGSAYIVRNVVLQYGAYESWKLSELSHRELSWKNARKGIPDGENGSRKLSLDDIRTDAEKVRPYDSLWDMYYDEFDDAEVVE